MLIMRASRTGDSKQSAEAYAEQTRADATASFELFANALSTG